MRPRHLLWLGLVSACTVGDLPPHDAGVATADARRADGGLPPWTSVDGASHDSGSGEPGSDGPAPAIDLRGPSLDGPTTVVDMRAPTVDATVPDVPIFARDGASVDLALADVRPSACSWWRGGRTLSWTKLDGLPSSIRSLARGADGALFAGSTGNGVYRSADRGVTWSAASTGLPTGTVASLFPCDTSALCVSLGSAIYASADSGAHWSQRGDTTASSYGFDAVFLSPRDPQTLFGAIYEGLMKSDDGGQGWYGVGAGLPGGPTVIAVSPVDGNVVYAGTGRSSQGQGVWKSTDGGRTFASSNRGMLDLTISELAVASDGTVYAAGALGLGGDTKLFRSDDSGANWIPLAIDFSYSSGGLARVVVSGPLSDTVFVMRTSLAIEVSCDRGATWSTLVPAAGGAGSTMYTPAFLVDVDSSGGLVLLAGAAGVGATGSVAGGYRASSAVDVPDAGAPVVVDAGAGAVDAAAPFCPFWKSGRVVSWKSIDTLPKTIYAMVADPAGPDLFAGASSGVYKSSDQGATWVSASAGIPSGQAVPALTVCGQSPTTVCAASGNELFASSNGGISWSKRASNVYGFSLLCSFPGDPSTVFGLDYNSLMRSDDSGAGWTPVGTGLSSEPSVLAPSPIDNNLVYAANGDFSPSAQGVWKSTDRGSTFVAANKGMLDAAVRDLLVGADGTVYAAGEGKLFRSGNGGADWVDITSRLAPIGGAAGMSRLARGAGGAIFLMTTAGQTQVSCDGGNTWRTLVAASNGEPSSRTPILLPVGDAQHLILLSAFDEYTTAGGGKRAVIE